MKVIIVDDNKIFRESLKYFLENMFSYEVIEMANDGTEFLSIENTHEADAILMDIEMPNINGIEAAKMALYDQPWLKFIAITNYSDRAYLMDLLSAGFKGCVFKNNIYEELNEALSKLSNNQSHFPKDIMIINKNNY